MMSKIRDRNLKQNLLVLTPLIGILLFFSSIRPVVGREQSLKKQLWKAVENDQSEKIDQLARKFIDKNETAGIEFLANLLPKVQSQSDYFSVIDVLRTIESRRGIQRIHRIIDSKQTNPAVRRDLFFALKLNESEHVNPVLLQLLKSRVDENKILALEEVANRRIRGSIYQIIQQFNSWNQQTTLYQLRANQALRSLTGKEYHSPGKWEDWWYENKQNFQIPGKEPTVNKLVGKTLRGTRRAEFETMVRPEAEEKSQKDRFVVVEGSFDNVGEVLKFLEIPFTKISRNEFRDYSLKNTLVLLINCDNYLKHPFSEKARAKIEEFVSRGGYLFTSDWGLVDVIEPVFPGTIEWAMEPIGRKNVGAQKQKSIETPKMTVQIWPERGRAVHPLLKDVFIRTKPAKPPKRAPGETGIIPNLQDKKLLKFRWHLDDESKVIDVKSPAVEVLAESPELKQKFHGHGTVACTFFYRGNEKKKNSNKDAAFVVPRKKKKISSEAVIDDLPALEGGRVLHVMGHFKKQMRPDSDGYALQKMLVNFLVEAQLRNRME